jgi:glutamine synthetase
LRLAKRVEVRFPDPLANNPCPGFAAMLMAGLDGVKNEFDPEKPAPVLATVGFAHHTYRMTPLPA